MNKYWLFKLLCALVFTGCITKGLEVKVVGREILVDNLPYTIKGVCYHPVSKGNGNQRSFENLTQDIALMKEIGVNTIRVFEPIKEIDVLDEFARNNIKIIIGIGYNQNGEYDIKSGSYLNYIKRFRNHKAILMWELGNEYNYHPEWFRREVDNWYRILNEAAERIHEIDKNHPVSSAHGDLPDEIAMLYCRNVDVWGMNVYRWDDPSSIFDEWECISGKPMYVSETGSDSYMAVSKNGFEKGENQKAQAEANKKILKEVFAYGNVCSGVTLFSFADCWWKIGDKTTQDVEEELKTSGVPYDGVSNEEYWGIVDIDRNKKQSFHVVKEIYQGIKKK